MSVEGKDALPVLLHVDDRPLVDGRGVERDVEFPEMRLAVVGIFTFRIGMVDDQAEPRATGAERRPLQHFEIAVGVAEGGDRTPANVLVDADRLARLVVDEIDVGQPEERWRTVLDLKSGFERRSDHLLRRYSVNPLGPGPHEFDAAARRDEG